MDLLFTHYIFVKKLPLFLNVDDFLNLNDSDIVVACNVLDAAIVLANKLNHF